MELAHEMTGTEQLWGTFERDREILYEQFQNVPYDERTGLCLEELEHVVEAFLEGHADLPRVLQKAHVFRLVVTRGQIAVDPRDWYAGHLNHSDLLRKLSSRWEAEARAGMLQEEACWFARTQRAGLVKGGLDTGHISPGWENMYAAGLTGLIAQAGACRESLGAEVTAEQMAFYEAVEIVYRAAITLAERYADLAEATAEGDAAHAARLRAVAAACRQVPAQPPRTFHEALQFSWLMHELIEMEGEYVRSMGHFDRTYYPYYRADLEAGRLTREQASELIRFLWIKFHARTRGQANGKNYCFGGQDADGRDVTNELTYLALEAYEALNTPDPKLSVRYYPGTPDALHRRVADLIRRGHNSFVLMNDVPAIEGLLKRGKTPQDARRYLPIGCYEPAVEGKEAACTMNLVINLAKGLELALHDGRDPLSGEQLGPHTGDPRGFETFEQIYAAYAAQMAWVIERSVACVGAFERQWPQINPSPLIAGTIEDCLARGKDIGQGGPHYNAVGCVGLALGNTCDALLALKKAVFEERRYGMEQILSALQRDYQGDEPLRQYLLHRVPKWGNNDPESDALARRIADDYCARVHTLRNARGGPCQAALFSLDYQWTLGEMTGALPDGRKARTSLAPGVGPSSGLDKSGVTALMNSVTALDFSETPNGTVLDVTLHPSAVRGEEGLEAFVMLIKTFLARGGYAVQFNVVDADTLRDAQRYPEHYGSLQIRVTGWSVFFVNLPREEQEQFIIRIAHQL